MTAPPYDVIDADDCARLRARDPHNVVHLTSEPDERAAAERLGAGSTTASLVRDDDAGGLVPRAGLRRPGRRRAATRRDRRLAPRRAVHGPRRPAARAHARGGARGPASPAARDAHAARADLPPLRRAAAPLARPDERARHRRRGTRGSGDSRATRRPGVLPGRQLLIADGHHRYEAALAFAAEDGADRMLVVLVSTGDPGLEVFPTHRVFTGRPEIDPAGRAVRHARGRARGARPRAARTARRRLRAARRRRGSCAASRASSTSSSSTASGHDGISYTPDATRRVRRVESGEADCAFLLRPPRVARRVRPGPPRADDAAEGDVLLPEAALGAPLPSARPVTRATTTGSRSPAPASATSRTCSATCRHGPSASRSSGPAKAATTRPRSTRRPRMRSSSGSSALGARPDARLGGARRPDVRQRRRPARRRRPDRRLGEREARHPVLLPLARRRGGRHDGRRLLRLRLRLRRTRGVGRRARTRGASSTVSRSTGRGRRTTIEILSLEGTTTEAIAARRSRRSSGSRTASG